MFSIYLCLILFYFIFQLYHFSPTQSNNIYHILYEILIGMHIHKLFNQCFFFLDFVDNNFITVLILLNLLFVFVIIIFFMDFTFSIESSRRVLDVSSLSVREVSIVSWSSSFSSFLNSLNP